METVVYLSNINPRPRTHIEIGVDVEDYYKLKSKEKSHIPVDVDMDEYRGFPIQKARLFGMCHY